MRRTAALCLLAMLGGAPMSDATEWPDPKPEDVASIDGMIRAAYLSVSAAPGDHRDLDRFRSLWQPGARLVAMARNDQGVSINVLGLEDFVRAFSGPVERGVFERELTRRTEQFGDMAHVWSTYEVRNSPDGAVLVRGINSLQLVHDGARWWFVAGLFQNEEAGLELPESYSGGS
jgi:hypothetical protein